MDTRSFLKVVLRSDDLEGLPQIIIEHVANHKELLHKIDTQITRTKSCHNRQGPEDFPTAPHYSRVHDKVNQDVCDEEMMGSSDEADNVPIFEKTNGDIEELDPIKMLPAHLTNLR